MCEQAFMTLTEKCRLAAKQVVHSDAWLFSAANPDEDIALIALAMERVCSDVLISCIHECDRHALFLKYEREHGGDAVRLKAREDEAVYLAGNLRALAEPKHHPPYQSGGDGGVIST